MKISELLAIPFNATLGTWYLPLGLHNPDPAQSHFAANLHKQMLKGGSNHHHLPLVREGCMKAFAGVAAAKSLVTGNWVEGGQFITPTNQTLNNSDQIPPISYFGGSGGDMRRARDTVIKNEFGAVVQAAQNSGITAPMAAYMYESTPTAWFDRLGQAYRLNRDPNYVSPEAQRFVERYWLPEACHVVSGVRNPSNNRLVCGGTKHPDDITLRQTLIGQSYGGSFIWMAVNAMNNYLGDLGHDDKSKQAFWDQTTFVVSLSGAMPIDRQPARPGPTMLATEHVYDFVGTQMDRTRHHPHLSGQQQKALHEVAPNRYFQWLNHPLPRDNPPDYGYHNVGFNIRGLIETASWPIIHEALSNPGLPDEKWRSWIKKQYGQTAKASPSP